MRTRSTPSRNSGSRPSRVLCRPDDVDDRWDKRLVSRWHRVIAELRRPHPLQRLGLARLHKTVPAPADVERHEEVEAVVAVTREGQGRQARFLDSDAELLVQL